MSTAWTLIFEGRVVDVVTTDPAGRYAPGVGVADVSQVTPQPQVGWTATETNGAWSFAPPATAPAPTPAQQAMAMLAAGCQVVSTGTPALSGTYALIPGASGDPVAKIMATSLYIQVNGKFPAAQATLPWPDAAGALHAFPTTAEFQAFATAVADHVAALDLVISGAATTLPAQPVTIA